MFVGYYVGYEGSVCFIVEIYYDEVKDKYYFIILLQWMDIDDIYFEFSL